MGNDTQSDTGSWDRSLFRRITVADAPNMPSLPNLKKSKQQFQFYPSQFGKRAPKPTVAPTSEATETPTIKVTPRVGS